MACAGNAEQTRYSGQSGNASERRKAKVTLGMATFREFDTTAFTLRSIRMHHDGPAAPHEIIVVDNDPKSRAGQRLRVFCGSVDAKYVPFTDVVGTSAPRNEIFRHATGDVVLVVDSHILLSRGVFTRLSEFASANPDNLDLWHGPMEDDRPNVIHATHFDPIWGEDFMYGKWGRDERATATNSAPFEIPGMGLGLFACRREAWLGFPEGLRGFGGEEMMIHEKFRQAGRISICLPFLRWWHLFRDSSPDGGSQPPYPMTMEDRFRNYVIWHRHLGLPEDELIERFRRSRMARNVDRILKTVGAVDRFDGKAVASANAPPDPETLEGRYWIARRKVSDINQHCDTLRRLSGLCDTVVEFGVRHGVSTVALLAGQPKKFISYDVRQSAEAEELKAVAGKTDYRFVIGDSLTIDPVDCDMLFLDTIHTKAQVAGELARHAANVRKYLVFHDTTSFGKTGEDRGPGIMAAISDFLRANPEWIVVDHFQYNNGLMVLSRDPADKRPLPSPGTMLLNVTAAYTKDLLNGQKRITDEQAEQRASVCTFCRHRNGKDCAACGCPLERKIPMQTENCPLGLWPDLRSAAVQAHGNPAGQSAGVASNQSPERPPEAAQPPAEAATQAVGTSVDPEAAKPNKHRCTNPQCGRSSQTQHGREEQSMDQITGQGCDHEGAIHSDVTLNTTRDDTGNVTRRTVTTICQCGRCGQKFTPVVGDTLELPA